MNKNLKVRPLSYNGVLYPDDSKKLDEYLSNSLTHYREESVKNPYAMIVPYANYKYAKDVYGISYSQIIGESIDTVVIIAPVHKIAFEGIILPDYDLFNTPFGEMEVDKESAKFLNKYNSQYIYYDKKYHLQESGIEMQLPYIHFIFKNKVKILPIIIGISNTKITIMLSKALFELNKKIKRNFFIITAANLSKDLKYDEVIRYDENFKNALLSFNADFFSEQLAMNQIIAYGGAGVISILRYGELLNRKNVKVLKLFNTSDILDDKLKVSGYISAVFW
ncbi:MAG: AmmeMemoRadiSam system protein B [Spirochaetes bacterium]|nr:AmmeMemoRadiSam system protein B [Spirochaetota bacterium]